MYDVVTIGSATLDIFVKSNQFKVVEDKGYESGLALCEAYGGKLEIDEVHMVSGGGATNNAVSFSRKGLKVACIAEMGEDSPADTVLTELKKENVDTKFVIQEKSENTGVSVIMIAPEGGRSIVTCRGAAGMLDLKDIPWGLLDTKWLYISSLGGQLELLKKLVSYAREKGIKVALNPGTKELSHAKVLRELAEGIEVLILNLEEARLYLELDDNFEEKALLKKLSKEGGKISLITNGNKGAYVLSDEKNLFSSPTNEHVVETTGAGDAFGSGFVAGRILGLDWEHCVSLARKNAESVIRFFGAKKGLLGKGFLDNLDVKGIEDYNL